MTPDLLVVFALGLAGSLHCLGMCGPLVLSYSMGLRGPRPIAHLAYNAGRILTYMALGAVAGTVGRAIGFLGKLAGLASGARIFAGAAMIVAGVLMVSLTKSKPVVRIGPTRRFSQIAGKLILGPTPGNKFALGLLLGFLPCGMIYAALLKALESGGALDGALTMLAFGLGTSIALFATGLASSILSPKLGRWSNQFAAASIVIFGAILLWRGIAAKAVCHG